MLYYTLPFLVCGTWLIIRRTFIDGNNEFFVDYNQFVVDYIIRIIKKGGFDICLCESTVTLVLTAIHHVIFPLKGLFYNISSYFIGFMDAVVYCLLSKWFLQKAGQIISPFKRKWNRLFRRNQDNFHELDDKPYHASIYEDE